MNSPRVPLSATRRTRNSAFPPTTSIHETAAPPTEKRSGLARCSRQHKARSQTRAPSLPRTRRRLVLPDVRTGRVAGIESKSLRDDARFCAVERLPRLSEACAPLVAPGAARGAARFFARVLARAAGALSVTEAVVFLRAVRAVESGFRAFCLVGVAWFARVGGSSAAADGREGPGDGAGTSAPAGAVARGKVVCSKRLRARLCACFCLWRSCRMPSP
jgi:hypothetical protein